MEYKPSFADQLDENYISHHGILGMRWGIRRYQNPDGTLTPAGKKRYARSIAAVDYAKKNLDDLREEAAHKYAINQNNYDVLKKARDENIENGWTREEQDKKFPYMNVSIDNDGRKAQFYKSQVRVIDAMHTKISDIDVTKQSFKDTVQLVNDILDDGVVSMKQVQNEYLKSPEYIKYKRLIESREKIDRQNSENSLREIYNEYAI